MLFLKFHRWLETNTMAPSDLEEDEFVEYVLPIDLLGPFEKHEKGTIINLRNNMGYVIVKETIEQIEQLIGKMMAASQQSSIAR